MDAGFVTVKVVVTVYLESAVYFKKQAQTQDATNGFDGD
jgi:hypothetical protein